MRVARSASGRWRRSAGLDQIDWTRFVTKGWCGAARSPHDSVLCQRRAPAALAMSYPKRRAAAIAEELTKQELAQDQDNDEDDEDEDGNFKLEEAPEAAKHEAAGPKRKRGPSGLAMSDSDDEDGGSGAAAGAARAAAQAARAGGGKVLNSLEQLKDAAKRRKTDALFEELNAASKPARPPVSPNGVPAKGSKMKCMMRAQVRAGADMTSAAAGELKAGEVIEVIETTVLPTGPIRCRFARGWVSVKTGAGATILQQMAAPASMFPAGTRTAAGSSGLSIEALAKKLASKGTEGTPATADATGDSTAPVPVRKNKMNDILAGLKKGQISTTAKSRGQWDSYKKEAGIDEELKQKAKDGYIVKQEFLERVDWRTHEKELENKKDVGWKGMN